MAEPRKATAPAAAQRPVGPVLRPPAPAPFRLLRPPPAAPPPLDPAQQAVVAHRGGPLLVLAGPGTGKTTTLVAAVLDRTRGPGALRPEEILVLTFSRAAAAELRDRIGAGLAYAAAAGAAVDSAVGATAEAAGAAGAADQGTTSADPAPASADPAPTGPARAVGAPTATTFHAFCFALLGQYRDTELFADPLRLLSGPEQDVAIRELVRGTVEEGAWGAGPGGWPQALREALGTRGFAEELRAVLLRAREVGVGPVELAEFADRAGRPDWRAAAIFFEEYLDVSDARGVLDYAELMHRAVQLLETDDAVREEVRTRYRAVFVDEYQDTDPAQVRLLEALAGGGRDLVAVGDPDQSIYAFRGADVTGILDFPSRFRHADGREAGIAVLRTSRRAGPVLLRASRELAKRMPLGRLPAEQVRQHRQLGSGYSPPGPPAAAGPGQLPAVPGQSRAPGQAGPPGPGRGAGPADAAAQHAVDVGGRVEVSVHPDAASELAAAADLLRRAHLERDVPWDAMAVLARTGDQLLGVRRALTAAGIPVEVLGDDVPLAREPAVAALLASLRCAADPAALTVDAARDLLTGPLGGLDGAGLRRLGRLLRDRDRLDGGSIAASAERAEAGAADGTGAAPSGAPSALSGGSESGARGETAAKDASADDGSADDGSDEASDDVSDRSPHPSGPRPGRSADQLIRAALTDPDLLTDLAAEAGTEDAARAAVVARLLGAAAAVLDRGGAVEDALWVLWSGDARPVGGPTFGGPANPAARPGYRDRTGWPERLRRAAERGGPAGRLADRDLDAVIALFAVAERARERAGGGSGRAGVTDFISGLQAQVIAADTLAERAARGGAVQIATAHAAKGLQWQVVAVVGVQEGLWPDLRRRGSLLDADRIGPAGLSDPLPAAALLAEERRLFYVAVTRARELLSVSAVADDGEDGDQPSRFLQELGVEAAPAGFRRRRPLELPALLADLRRTATDPAAPAPLREAAVLRLARLAAAADERGRTLFPGADPGRWWGLYDYTEAAAPVADPDQPVPLTPSGVDALDSCALRWFLERKAAAEEQTTDTLAFGRVFHALAEEVATGRTAPDIDVLMGRLDRVWDALPFDARWKSDQEKRAARRALERFLAWHADPARGRDVVDVERQFTETLAVGGVAVRLNGKVDRLEVDEAGRLYVVDFKTAKHAKSKAEAERDPQLGVYQVMIRAEGYQGGEPAGAELVYPRDDRDTTGPTVVPQPGLQDAADPQWAENLVAGVARRVLAERFHAYGDDQRDCRTCGLRRACPKQAEGRELPL